jgi:hypothetical protein
MEAHGKAFAKARDLTAMTGFRTGEQRYAAQVRATGNTSRE